jgi:NAD(P)-dependent dehydrogenase (short-subunit alcohol dehydrogenase family)
MYNLCKIVKPIMISRGGGSIIAIGASDSVRQEGNAAYGTAKSGILGLTKNLAREFYEDNIRVNCVAAGLFRGKLENREITTAENTLLRTGYPQDIAYASLFFASDESNWVTGQILTVDGGVDVGTRPLWQYEK